MTIERRAAVELRAADGKTPRLVGLAAVYNSLSEDLGGFRERVLPGAFRSTLQSNQRDVLALVGHASDKIIGRSSAGTLNLSDDPAGLRFEIIPPDTSVGRDLLVSVQRRDITGASIGFRVNPGGDRWDTSGGEVIRELRDVELVEVSIVGSPAYPATDVSIALRAFNARYVPPARLRAAQRWLESV